MRKLVLIGAAVLLVAGTCAGPAAAFKGGLPIARSLAMGNASTAVADDSAAWSQNPAGLVSVRGADGMLNLIRYHSDASISSNLGGDLDTWALSYSASQFEGKSGFGAGYFTIGSGPGETKNWGIGYGRVLDTTGPSAGIALRQTDPATGSETTMIDLGVLWRQQVPLNTLKLGVVGRDMTSENQFTLDVGASVQTPAGVLVAADLVDLTDEVETTFNVGVEWRPPLYGDWVLRAGLADGEIAYGAGYNFQLVQSALEAAVAHQELNGGGVTVGTLRATFSF
jgi:hypothetical protein